MRRKSLTSLGETEMEVLQHVWDLGEATVADVHGRIAAARPVAYTTIMTVMKNLAQKGYLSYRSVGASYVYRPARRPEEVRAGIVDVLVDKVFKGSRLALVEALVHKEDFTEAERAALAALVEEIKRKEG